jgi:hypothetical protein
MADAAFGGGYKKKNPQLTGSVAKFTKERVVEPNPSSERWSPCGDLPQSGMFYDRDWHIMHR